MREIEFRAYLKKNQQIVDVLDIDFMQEAIGYMNKADTKYTCVKFDDIELMQYTGVKDKNGKKIFEGDIVKCVSEDFEESVGQGVFEVVFETRNKTAYFGIKKDGKNTYGFNFDFTPANKCEVIGNIYDNPELLEEQDVKD